MGGAETQASWAAPPSSPPPSPRAPTREPGRGRRQGREERGREGEEGAGQGGRWGGVGREKKKENIFRVPACGVSVRFGRKCVGYFGAVTWAGGLREAPGLSQPRAVPPGAPHYRDSQTPRRSIPETARRRGVPRPSFPRPPLQVPSPQPGPVCRRESLQRPEGPLEPQWAGQPGWARSLPGQVSGHGRGLQLKTTPAHCRFQGIPTPQLPWPPIKSDSFRLVPWGLDLVTQEQASPLPSQGHSEGRHHLKC